MPEAAKDHPNVVSTILVEPSAIPIGPTIEILTFLDCVVVGDHSDNPVWLIGASLELAENYCIIEFLFGDVCLLLVEIDGNVRFIEDFFDG